MEPDESGNDDDYVDHQTSVQKTCLDDDSEGIVAGYPKMLFNGGNVVA